MGFFSGGRDFSGRPKSLAAQNKKPGTAFRKKRRWSVSILKQGCVIDRPVSARSAWGPRGRMSIFPISYTLYAPIPAIIHWTSRAVVQSFVAEIPFIAEASRRDRYAKELGFFPRTPTFWRVTRKSRREMLVPMKNTPIFGGFVAYLGAELQFFDFGLSWAPFRNAELDVQPELEVGSAACRQALHWS